MKLIHNRSMNYKRITVSLPDYLYEDLLTLVPARGVSGYVAEAIEKRIIQRKTKREDAFENFLALRDEAPKRNVKQILAAIHKGRT